MPTLTTTGADRPVPTTASAPRHARRRAALVAGGVLLATYSVLASGGLPGWFALAFLVPVLLAPTAASLALRVTANGALLLGWMPVVWFLPVGSFLNRGALVCALSLAGSAYLVLRDTAGRVPLQAGRSAFLLPVGAVLAALAVHPWVTVRTPSRAVELMLRGYDSAAHYFMFAMAHQQNTPLPGQPRLDGSAWAFDRYPQGFHLVAATVADLLDPSRATGTTGAVTYLHACAAVVVLGTVVAIAAVLALPGVDARPAVGVPAVVLVLTALLWSPGAGVLADGFANFWLTAVAGGVAVLLALRAGSGQGGLIACACSGLLVLVAYSWTPLLVLVLPVVLALLAELRRGPSRPPVERWLVRAVVGAGAVAGALAVALQAVSVPVGLVVAAVGPIRGAGALPVLLLVAASLLLSIRLRRGAGALPGAVARRAGWTSLVPLAAVTAAVGLLLAQVSALGTTSYYFVKLVVGIVLVLAIVVAGLGAVLVAAMVPAPTRADVERDPGRRARGVLLATAATAAALVAPGFVGPADAPLLGPWPAGAPSARAWVGSAADDVVAAAQGTSPRDASRRDYLAVGENRGYEAIMYDTWFHALTGSLTTGTYARMTGLAVRAGTVEQAVPVVDELSRRGPDRVVVVAPEHAAALREAVRGIDVEVVPAGGR